MQRSLCYSYILLLAFQTGLAHADFTGRGHVHTRSETKQIFLNPDCRATDSCDLIRFTLTKIVNEIWFSDNPDYPTYGNGVIMEYETDTVSALEKYAVVQFKKGCVFDTAKTSDGKIRRLVTDTVASFGEQVPFCFRRWVIDSQDRDPAYNSDPKYGRFYLLRWNRPGSYDNKTQKYYGMEKPPAPVLYMSDYPAGAFIAASGVRNVALEFKSCIYKAVDVPLVTQRESVAFAQPLKCFEWQNVYVYDFTKANFRTDLAAVPSWEEPAPPVAPERRAIVIALWIAIALVIFWRLSRFGRQSDQW